MIRILFSGIGGRIGHTMFNVLLKNETYELVGGVDPFANQKDFDCPVFASFDEVNVEADVIIDFSTPASLGDMLSYALKNKLRVIIATTGHSAEQLRLIESASKEIAIFHSSNMSLGVNLLINLSKEAAKFLGDDYEIEIIEQHHNKKLDAPSGTALTIANAINGVLDDRLDYVYGRHDANHRREHNELGIHAVRGGSIVGKHDVMYIGKGETLTLSHESSDKEVFVYGSLRAASYIIEKKSGLFDMNSILGSFYSVTSVTAEPDNTLFTVAHIDSHVVNALLKKLNEHNVNLDMISQTVTDGGLNVSFTCVSADSFHAVGALAELKLPYTAVENAAKLTAEGAGMAHRSGVAMEVLNILDTIGAKVFAITTSETKISCCIDKASCESSESALRKYYGIR